MLSRGSRVGVEVGAGVGDGVGCELRARGVWECRSGTGGDKAVLGWVEIIRRALLVDLSVCLNEDQMIPSFNSEFMDDDRIRPYGYGRVLWVDIHSDQRPFENWRNIWTEGSTSMLYFSYDIQYLSLEVYMATDIEGVRKNW